MLPSTPPSVALALKALQVPAAAVKLAAQSAYANSLLLIVSLQALAQFPGVLDKLVR